MPFTLRNYSPHDRDECLSVFRTNVPTFFRDHELNDFEQFIDASGCLYFVVLEDDEIVGCGGYGLTDDSETADLCWGMARADLHGKRVGEFLLLGRLHTIIENTVANAVRLSTSQLTDGFFRHYGFELQSIKHDGIATGLDDVEMRLELNDATKQTIIGKWEEVTDGS